MHVFVTGGTGHSGPYIISDLIAAGHEVTALARSDKAAAAVSALGAKARLGSLEDLDGLKEAAAASDGVIHVAHRQDLMPVGGINAVADAELQIMLAYGEALAGTGKPLVSSGSIGSPGWENLGRPATEEDPPLSGGDPYKNTLRVRNIVETTVIGLAEKGVRSRRRMPSRARRSAGHQRSPACLPIWTMATTSLPAELSGRQDSRIAPSPTRTLSSRSGRRVTRVARRTRKTFWAKAS
ncbi:NAD(P)H-binding protein [Paraburkholderia dilworthii]|uniref:NAD(P)H-binding protein n=1 Tax=Paraburkholderia dilworthii TaxID=948106 RepID=UPI000400426B